MTSRLDQDLPQELLDKLRNLELELEDGDITQKGFEKKKASLLQNYARQVDAEASNDDKNDNTELEIDLGPEPSAADVLDFLDYLPSPTHSPPKPQGGAALMEENHRQLQETSQSSSTPSPAVYNTAPAQPVYAATQNMYGGGGGGGGGGGVPQAYTAYGQPQPQPQTWTQQYPDGQYYRPGVATPRPNRPYDPRMVPRPYQNNGIPPPSSPMRHPYPYQRPSPPPNSTYRPVNVGSGGPGYGPVYNAPPRAPAPGPQQGSPRPIYRTGTVTQPIQQRSPGAYGGAAYRPMPPGNGVPAHGRTSSLDARNDLYYDNGRVPYNYGPARGVPPPSSMGHRSNIPPEVRRG